MTDKHTFSPALSPLDGRYRDAVAPLTTWLSEEGLNQSRIQVEVAWMIFALNRRLIPGLEPLTEDQLHHLRSLHLFTDQAARERLAAFERETRHDVKAVEYLIRHHLESMPSPAKNASENNGDHSLAELVHFLCTSEDINNLAYALAVKQAITTVWLPAAEGLQRQIMEMSRRYARVPMLGRTHGQPATPTTVGKELRVFGERMSERIARIRRTSYRGKFNGATGTFSAHTAVLPDVDWMETSRAFVESLGLHWSPVTTQIEPHDWQIELYGEITHFNRIAHNLATDTWGYISLGYFRQNLAGQGSTGSSTMPHKVNPIRFENAEANFEMSDGILETLSRSLATTRFQRDLSDSSLQRNIGVGLGYSLVGIDALNKGLQHLEVDTEKTAADLHQHPEVLAEAIQQALRLATLVSQGPGTGWETDGGTDAGSDADMPDSAHSVAAPDPYLLLKELTRGKQVNLEALREVVREAALPESLRDTLLEMEPADYVGLATELAEFDPNVEAL